MDRLEIKHLSKSGHEIGLHTHNHPTNIDTYTYDAEYVEYTKNLECLTGILGHKNICSAALPCGLNSLNTHKIMEKIGVDLCFAAEMGVKSFPILWSNRDWTTCSFLERVGISIYANFLGCCCLFNLVQVKL